MPNNILIIGDRLDADIIGSMKVGMNVIHFNSHYEDEHDYYPIVYKLTEIKDLIN